MCVLCPWYQHGAPWQKHPIPPPLSNKPILTKVNNGHVLKRDLVEETDYATVSEPAWQLLTDWFGNDGMDITRFVVSSTPNDPDNKDALFVESERRPQLDDRLPASFKRDVTLLLLSCSSFCDVVSLSPHPQHLSHRTEWASTIAEKNGGNHQQRYSTNGVRKGTSLGAEIRTDWSCCCPVL